MHEKLPRSAKATTKAQHSRNKIAFHRTKHVRFRRRKPRVLLIALVFIGALLLATLAWIWQPG